MPSRGMLASLLSLFLAGLPSPGVAQEPPGCPMHQPHDGPHERSSCGVVRLGAVEVSADAGIGQIEVHGDIAAVVLREEGRVALLDVSDPADPRVLGHYDGNTGQPALDDPLDGDVAFSADGRFLFYARQTRAYSNEGIHAIDISDPTAPRLVAYAPQGGTLRVAAFSRPGAEYVVSLDAVTGMMVFRFQRAATGGALIPVHVDAQPLLKVGGPASAGLFVDPHDPILGIPLLYVSTGRTGLQVFDLSVPEDPVELGSWSDRGLADIEVAASEAGRTVYAATEYWFQAQTEPRILELDATDLSQISERLRFSPGDPAYPSGPQWRVQGIELSDGRLYVAHSHAGIGVLDLCCLGQPPVASSSDLGEGNRGGEFPTISAYAMDVEVSGRVVHVTDAGAGTLTTFRVET